MHLFVFNINLILILINIDFIIVICIKNSIYIINLKEVIHT